MLKLVVFDWDGTLSNSVEKIIACKKDLAIKYNLRIPSKKRIKNVLGMKFEKAMRICFHDANDSVLYQISNEFKLEMQKNKYKAELFSGTKEMLLTLKSKGIQLAVATSKSREELNKALIDDELINIFDITCCGEEFENKPDPKMLHYIINQLRVNPSEFIMVGDTTIDVEFANNAKANIMCVTFGAHSIEKLGAVRPLALLHSWNEFLNKLEICNI